ncbi:MAG: TetR/AcrR family transcriptional regulator [Chloroflexi bacterium]|uniref:TetR/AcrR family transcriptional regulator n=1 Tax=Candidatus Chlorohelix allophototropha TaxID=3003348 RepID=A0A8T7M267_9CHLR|nr:TetR/AcrR family transcriptional regulator [Chloroflexota bacterium]WJW67861.1 TetR/AcrR family transcriptional regulator [Chloroflexota bacterium L227-S17]
METKPTQTETAHKSADRRIQRTRNLLQEALISLIQEKDYDDITVQDLLDRANVGRSTFYSHFLDKDELLMSGLEKLRVSFEEQHQKLGLELGLKNSERQVSLAFFKHAQSHYQVYKAVVGKRSGTMITKTFYEYLKEMFRGYLAKNESPGGVPLELVVQFQASSLMALLTWWFDNDLPYSAEQMNNWYHQLAGQFLA